MWIVNIPLQNFMSSANRYPSSQEQLNPPSVLLHICSHGLSSKHSSISTNDGKPNPPSLHWTCTIQKLRRLLITRDQVLSILLGNFCSHLKTCSSGQLSFVHSLGEDPGLLPLEIWQPVLTYPLPPTAGWSRPFHYNYSGTSLIQTPYKTGLPVQAAIISTLSICDTLHPTCSLSSLF